MRGERKSEVSGTGESHAASQRKARPSLPRCWLAVTRAGAPRPPAAGRRRESERTGHRLSSCGVRARGAARAPHPTPAPMPVRSGGAGATLASLRRAPAAPAACSRARRRGERQEARLARFARPPAFARVPRRARRAMLRARRSHASTQDTCSRPPSHASCLALRGLSSRGGLPAVPLERRLACGCAAKGEKGLVLPHLLPSAPARLGCALLWEQRCQRARPGAWDALQSQAPPAVVGRGPSSEALSAAFSSRQSTGQARRCTTPACSPVCRSFSLHADDQQIRLGSATWTESAATSSAAPAQRPSSGGAARARDRERGARPASARFLRRAPAETAACSPFEILTGGASTEMPSLAAPLAASRGIDDMNGQTRLTFCQVGCCCAVQQMLAHQRKETSAARPTLCDEAQGRALRSCWPHCEAAPRACRSDVELVQFLRLV
jgi:hypothetical protein